MSEKLNTLDGMRGIAAISVLLLHIGNWVEHRWIFSHGYLAVDFFFCLSGFVMAHAYGERLTSRMSFKEFALQRFIRLYPVILLGMTLGALYYTALVTLTRYPHPFGVNDIGIAFALNVFLIPFYLVPSVVSIGIYPLNSPFWSIFFEIVANLIWARFLVRVPPTIMFGVAALLGLILFPFYERLEGGALIDQFWIGLLRVIVGFSAGLFVHKLFVDGRMREVAVNPFVLLAILFALFAMPNVVGVWYDMACTLLIFPSLVLFGARAKASGKSVLEWLGAISYPLYGTHRPLCLLLIFVVGPRLPGDLKVLATIVLSLVVSIAVAHLIFDYFDEPIRKVLRERLLGRRLRPATAGS
ncbi:acyltransferase [Bradyrhizobium diazoefficiens]|uniref:acyltransferase family protein n=1 Tax=Bradyrhizobium diazoefficiens TaxID=1355477 RepID=UPI00190995EC|nr:acyltransferase [Bradyrhizobium diazoefficiens]QQO13534.1 acyltransferase [Bradyrhizobium diazoefficiens]